jgi:hypothetical protein
MFMRVAMTVLCAVAVAFYMRFLIALCRELKPRPAGYWVRLRLGSGEDKLAEMQQRKPPATRVA